MTTGEEPGASGNVFERFVRGNSKKSPPRESSPRESSTGDALLQARNDSLLRYLRSQFDIIFPAVLQEIRSAGNDPVEFGFDSDRALRGAFMAGFVAHYAAEHLNQLNAVGVHTLDLHEMKERMRTLLDAIVSTRGDVKVALVQAGI